MDNIWNVCQGEQYFRLIQETAWRIVEAQDITSTRKLVDSYEEHVILEDLIEAEKPDISADILKLHPLLYTPFRYPPLKYGSRFGKKNEPSLWYGSLNRKTAMAEKAFYQLNFLRASDADYDMVQMPLTIFTTSIKTNKGIKLHETPFTDHAEIISAKDSYDHSQQLGFAMRAAEVQAFTYPSARHEGINIALFTAKAFAQKKPHASSFQAWQCLATKKLVEFIRASAINAENIHFTLEDFTVDGRLPFPAS